MISSATEVCSLVGWANRAELGELTRGPYVSLTSDAHKPDNGGVCRFWMGAREAKYPEYAQNRAFTSVYLRLRQLLGGIRAEPTAFTWGFCKSRQRRGLWIRGGANCPKYPRKGDVGRKTAVVRILPKIGLESGETEPSPPPSRRQGAGIRLHQGFVDSGLAKLPQTAPNIARRQGIAQKSPKSGADGRNLAKSPKNGEIPPSPPR